VTIKFLRIVAIVSKSDTQKLTARAAAFQEWRANNNCRVALPAGHGDPADPMTVKA
jgi:hypothetical protein